MRVPALSEWHSSSIILPRNNTDGEQKVKQTCTPVLRVLLSHFANLISLIVTHSETQKTQELHSDVQRFLTT